MKTLRSRTTLVATAIAAALSLSACGDGRDDTAATRDNATVATTPSGTTAADSTSSPYANDRVTADASSAAARADNATDRAAAKVDAAGDRAAAKVENAGDRAAAAAGDAALTAKVKAALMAEPGVDSLQIDVDTNNGRVTLSGEVDNPENRQRALQAARNVDGVSGVVDRLSMKR